ncbi:MAG: hypothetical protein GY859_16285 [Desulfobacterales bacterium]|nr:hypothetical protein [Desulfobacterales bacterium]
MLDENVDNQFRTGLIILLFIIPLIYFFAPLSPGPVFAAEAAPLAPPEYLHTAGAMFNAAGDSPDAEAADNGWPWRGLLIGADHGAGNIHHDNIYIKIDDGPILYQTTIPARKEGNLLPDQGLLWHFYTRDDTTFTVYAVSCLVDGLCSDLSDPFPLYFSYPSFGCTEQTVPVSDAGVDQVVLMGAETTLDASGSYDPHAPDTEELVYIWECYAAPEASVALGNNDQSAMVSFTPDVAGNYYFRLSVRDQLAGESFNRGPAAYVRVSAVNDPDDPYLVNANAGRTQQAEVGGVVALDGSLSRCLEQTAVYEWTHVNPPGERALSDLAAVLGADGCQGGCYKANFDADSDVDGADIALLAAAWGGVTLPDQKTVQFIPTLPGPYIFRLTVSDGIHQESETTIVAVNHPNANPALTPPEVDADCL